VSCRRLAPGDLTHKQAFRVARKGWAEYRRTNALPPVQGVVTLGLDGKQTPDLNKPPVPMLAPLAPKIRQTWSREDRGKNGIKYRPPASPPSVFYGVSSQKSAAAALFIWNFKKIVNQKTSDRKQ
jgi:hypothetical protein